MMRVRSAGQALLVATVLALAGCGSSPPASPAPPASSSGPTTSASPGDSASASPTASPGEVVEFSVDGAGPYQLGTKQSDLQAAGRLDAIGPGPQGCPDTTTARGTGKWTDVHLSFHKDGTLFLLENQSTSIPTPSGAYLGTSLADLKKIYAKTTNESLVRGQNTAFLVITISGRGILFVLSSIQTVTSMLAADVSYLRSNFVNGTPFC